jgi:tetratricopeptide (TPR) repeat protein
MTSGAATILSHIPFQSIAVVTRKKSPHKSSAKAESANSRPPKRKVEVAQAADGAWELVHPRCARTRQEDIEEVEKMIAAGEMEIAQDELRWLLSECHDFIAAHQLLGDVALTAGDFRLARGHFGYAYQLGTQAIDRCGKVDSLPSDRPSNQPFFAAACGLVNCLLKLGKRGLAKEITERLLKFDPRDLLQLQKLLASDRSENKPRPKRRR